MSSQTTFSSDGSLAVQKKKPVENPCTDDKGNHCEGDCHTCSKYPVWKRGFVNSATYFKFYHRVWS